MPESHVADLPGVSSARKEFGESLNLCTFFSRETQAGVSRNALPFFPAIARKSQKPGPAGIRVKKTRASRTT